MTIAAKIPTRETDDARALAALVLSSDFGRGSVEPARPIAQRILGLSAPFPTGHAEEATSVPRAAELSPLDGHNLIRAAIAATVAVRHWLRPAGSDEDELDPQTQALVYDFAAALFDTLLRAQRKYGRSNDWLVDDWEAECRTALLAHVNKGDPLDVAAYAAFCWRRGWSTSSARDTERVETL